MVLRETDSIVCNGETTNFSLDLGKQDRLARYDNLDIRRDHGRASILDCLKRIHNRLEHRQESLRSWKLRIFDLAY
jgi:hypothetical protein